MDLPLTAVIMEDGFQLPVIPFNEVAGKGGGVLFWQRGPIGVNNAMALVIVIAREAGKAH